MDNKEDEENTILKVYIKGDFIYASAKQGITQTEFAAMVGVYKSLLEELEKGKIKWIN